MGTAEAEEWEDRVVWDPHRETGVWCLLRSHCRASPSFLAQPFLFPIPLIVTFIYSSEVSVRTYQEIGSCLFCRRAELMKREPLAA